MRKIYTALFAFCCIFVESATAQTNTSPTIHSYATSETVYINKLSDNGKWAVASNVDANNSTLENYPYLFNTQDGTTLSLLSESEKLASPDCGARDVTDDGRTIVGSHQGKPAVCHIEDDGSITWEYLPLPSSMPDAAGYVTSVTPNGEYMVGTLHNNSGNLDGGYEEYPAMWKNGEIVELPNIPSGRNGSQLCRLIDISADGNILIGGLNYIYPAEVQHFVYYVPEQKGEIIGTEEFFSTGSTVTNACLSTNGEWIGGTARLITPIEGSDYPDQQEIPYTYNTKTKTFVPYTTTEHHGAAATAMFNNGLMAVASPISNPYRTTMFFINGYYYNLELILSEAYGIDFSAKTGLDNTGLIASISTDGYTLAGLAVNEGNYTVTLPESIESAASNVNLLSRFTVNPENGSSFTYLRTLTVTFDKAPTVVEGAQAALYKEGATTPVRTSISITPTNNSGQSLSFYINFRNTPLEDGAKYTVKIPAGTFRLGETTTYNRDIEISYTGRSEKPVQVVAVNLEDGTEVASLSYNIPVTMQFDTNISLVEGAKGALYQEGIGTAISELTLATSANMLAAYPDTKRNLFKDANYIVKIPAGSVTDIMGNCANEEITYHYIGAYVPEPPADTLLFADDFSDPSASYNNFMLYEGDHLVPNAVAQGWTFDTDNTPWNFTLREDESTPDFCSASISMYSVAGKSNDWMVTNQLYLPNAFCYLDFDVQSYLASKSDSLRIYVYTDDAVYTQMTEETINKVITEGACIFNELVTPGDSEEALSGDWSHYRLSLENFAGKNVYIAFANLCTDKSAIFVDNIKVVYKSRCLLALNSKTTLVNQEHTFVSGIVKVTDENEVYDNITVFFHNEDKTVSDTIREAGLALKDGTIYNFKFNTPLPLKVGEENLLTIGVILNGETKTSNFKIKNLAFATNKKVVIEEITGTWCTNCPDGMVALEHISTSFPDKIIPVCIHNNDIYANDDYAAALGLTALPTARVNRRDTITSPIVINTNTYEYSFTSAKGNESWMDHVLSELETEADADIDITKAGYDRTTGSLQVSTDITYAINKAGVAANVFYVLLEDELVGVQTNGRANATDPIYGDWGKNGKYGGQATVQIAYHDVARAVLASEQGAISGYSGIVPATVKSGEAISTSITFDGALSALSSPENGKLVCMLLDANTGRVINADVSTLTDLDPQMMKGEEFDRIHLSGTEGGITVVAPEATVTLYTPNGILLTETMVNGSATISTHGYSGMAIVRIQTAEQTISRKMIVK